MCWSHCNLFVNARPKYLADVTDSSLCPWSWYLASIVFFLFVTLSTVHLSGWSFMHHSFSHVPAYLDLFVEFQHRCCWILSGTLLCHRRRVLMWMLVLVGGRLCSRGRALDQDGALGNSWVHTDCIRGRSINYYRLFSVCKPVLYPPDLFSYNTIMLQFVYE